ncbi:retrotransposon gag protein, partial [Rhizoctonia solani AG-3 Rhs1AP]
MSPKAARLPMPYHVHEGELSLLALTSMTFPHPEAVGAAEPKRAYSDVVRIGLDESKSPGGATALGAAVIGGTHVLEQSDKSRKASLDAGQPSTLVGNGQGDDDPGYGRDLALPSKGPSQENMSDAVSAHVAGTAEMPGSYPVSEHAKRDAKPAPPPVTAANNSPDSESEGMEGGGLGSSSETPSPTREYVTAQGRSLASRSRREASDVSPVPMLSNSKFFPQNSLAIGTEDHGNDSPEKPDDAVAPESGHTQQKNTGYKLLKRQAEARRHAATVREHLRREEAAKREEDDYWMEMVSKLGHQSKAHHSRAPKRPHIDHTFEWEQPGQSATADFEDILRRFSDQSGDEEGGNPSGGRVTVPISSTPYPLTKKPRSVRVNAIAVEVEAESDDGQPGAGPSFWDKGKWPEVDINEVRQEQKARKTPGPGHEHTDVDADDEGNEDDDDEYIPSEPTRRLRRKPESSRKPQELVGTPDISVSKPKERKKGKVRETRSETPKYLGGYLAANHTIREMLEVEDPDAVSSDDGAGKALTRADDKKRDGKSKQKSRKHRKRSRSSSSSSSSSSESSSSSSSGSSSSSSSTSSSDSSSSSSSQSLSSSSDSSSNSSGDGKSGKSARRRRKREKESQKKATRKYKKLRQKIKHQSRSGWKAKQPTAYSGTANFDVFEQWVFEVDLWTHDTGFKGLEAVRHVSGFLSGKAASWYMNEVATNLKAYKRMWKLYQELFEHCFPFNYKQTLRERFQKAVQGNRSVKDYMRELRLYEKRLGDLAEREVRQRFWDGAHLYIRLKWTENGLNPEDSVLDKMIKTALRYERAEQMRVSETKKAEKVKSDHTRSKLTKPDKARNSRARSKSPSRFKGDKRDNQSKETRPERTGKSARENKSEKTAESTEQRLTHEEKEQYRAEGKCFKCGTVGHKSRDCPKKNKARPTKISSSAVRLKAMDDLADAVDRIECSAAKVKVAKKSKDQVAKAIERNASVVKDATRRVPKTIIVEVLINGEPAHAMLDTGSQSDLMSSTLADQLKLPKTRLGNPLCLQMASNYSTRA